MTIQEARETICLLLNFGYEKCDIIKSFEITGEEFELILDEDNTLSNNVLNKIPTFTIKDLEELKKYSHLIDDKMKELDR